MSGPSAATMYAAHLGDSHLDLLLFDGKGPQTQMPVAPGTFVQALVGVGDYGDSRRFASESNGARAVADVGTQVTGGLGGQHPLGSPESPFGFDAGFLFSGRSNRGRAFDGSGAVVAESKASWSMFEVFAGLYGSVMMGPRVRGYVGAGPAVVIADLELDDGVLEREDTEYAVGGYARAGLEYRLPGDQFLGFSARAVASRLDFDVGIGDVDLDGVQFFFTYSRRF